MNMCEMDMKLVYKFLKFILGYMNTNMILKLKDGGEKTKSPH
jgi:hypothetical protein